MSYDPAIDRYLDLVDARKRMDDHWRPLPGTPDSWSSDSWLDYQELRNSLDGTPPSAVGRVTGVVNRESVPTPEDQEESTYFEVTGRPMVGTLHTYQQWRDEYLRTGMSLPFDRMLSHVTQFTHSDLLDGPELVPAKRKGSYRAPSIVMGFASGTWALVTVLLCCYGSNFSWLAAAISIVFFVLSRHFAYRVSRGKDRGQ